MTNCTPPVVASNTDGARAAAAPRTERRGSPRWACSRAPVAGAAWRQWLGPRRSAPQPRGLHAAQPARRAPGARREHQPSISELKPGLPAGRRSSWCSAGRWRSFRGAHRRGHRVSPVVIAIDPVTGPPCRLGVGAKRRLWAEDRIRADQFQMLKHGRIQGSVLLHGQLGDRALARRPRTHRPLQVGMASACATSQPAYRSAAHPRSCHRG
jgi:hypothetical protein